MPRADNGLLLGNRVRPDRSRFLSITALRSTNPAWWYVNFVSGDHEPQLLSRISTAVPERRLTPRDIIFFAPLNGDVRQGFVAESAPGWFDVVPLKRAFEVPERPGAVDGKLKILADPGGLHRVGEVSHDGPLVDVELRR